MPIIVCGINHKTAPIALREKVVFPVEKLALYLSDLIAQDDVHEAVILSTCNRSELYCHADNPEVLIAWFCQQHGVSYQELEPFLHIAYEQQAIEHVMRVACGLDSMVLGESQILGQLKVAYSESCAAGTVGPLFHRLFQDVFAVAKTVRSNTNIGACPVSIASAAVQLVKQTCPALEQATILVIGAGATTDLVLQHLKRHTIATLLVSNRNTENAVLLAKRYEGVVIPFARLQEALAKADIVISATGSPIPIVTYAMLAPLVKKSLTIVDVAVPRDVEPSVGQLASVSLYCIDDLKAIIQHNLRGREHAAEKAVEVIQQKSSEFRVWAQAFDKVATTIRAYRKQVEAICDNELLKATRHLHRGDDPLQVLTSFAHAFTKKLLHTPSVQLRQAGFDGRLELLELARELFALSQPETE